MMVQQKTKKMRPFREDRPHLRSEGLRRSRKQSRFGRRIK